MELTIPHRNILERKYAELVERIEAKNNRLWEELIQRRVFSSNDVRDNKVNYQLIIRIVSFYMLKCYHIVLQ